jgi:hypothetical protein
MNKDEINDMWNEYHMYRRQWEDLLDQSTKIYRKMMDAYDKLVSEGEAQYDCY